MPNFEAERNSSLDNSKFEINPAGILLPSRASKNLILPVQQNVLPTLSEEELLKYAQPSIENTVTVRSSAELALADQIPEHFLAQELENNLPLTDVLKEVIKYFKVKGGKRVSRSRGEKEAHKNDDEHASELNYPPSALQRQKRIKKLPNLISGEMQEVQTSTSGAVEQAGCIIVDLLSEPHFSQHAGKIVLEPLSQLLKDYRVQTIKRGLLPEMPDLMSHIIPQIDTFPTRPGGRFALYGILEQIKIPPSFGHEILIKMDRLGDLDHPLAFQLTLEQAKQPGSEWTKEQEKRRQEMLELLKGSNQDLFDKFNDLIRISRGLVYSGDPRSPRNGKVGLEIEFMAKKQNKNGIYSVKRSEKNLAMSKDYFRRGKGIEDKWTIHKEPNDRNEVARADNHLEYNPEYEESLINLYKWFGDYAVSIDALHIHLDRATHQYYPKLGGLYEGYDQGRAAVHAQWARHSVGRSDRHRSWEIRSVAPPQGVGNLNPGRLADIINMYRGVTTFGNEKKDLQKLYISDEASLQQLIWGHLVTFMEEPQDRLSALMALHDTNALRFINPLAFIHTYTNESLPQIITFLKKTLTSTEDENMLEILDRITKEDTDDLLNYESKKVSRIAEDVLGDELLQKLTENDYQIWKEWGGYDYHKRDLLSKYGVQLFNRQHFGDENTSGEFRRDAFVQRIKKNATSRLERFQKKLLPEEIDFANLELTQKWNLIRKFQQVLRFDGVMSKFIHSYLFIMYSVYDPNEFEMADEQPDDWKSYMNDKNTHMSQLFHLFSTLEHVSDSLIKDLVAGNSVNLDTAFNFDEEAEFSKRMQQIYDALKITSAENQNEDAARIIRIYNGRHLIPVFKNEKRSREMYSSSVALLFWAHEHRIKDERLNPVKESILSAYVFNNLPNTYDRLLEEGFLGINNNDLPKQGIGINTDWK